MGSKLSLTGAAKSISREYIFCVGKSLANTFFKKILFS